MTKTKLLAVSALLASLLASAARGDEPAVKADAAIKAEAPATDRAARRAELVKEVAAARAERRQELRTGERPAASASGSERIAEAQKRREAQSTRRDEGRMSVRELQREHREELREHRRGMIRRTL